ncbi:hypothetical protein [Paenibacillus physcomitrellae]|nr:hypothetical protein [Paenibacillus physcomitrellae]
MQKGVRQEQLRQGVCGLAWELSVQEQRAGLPVPVEGKQGR